MTHLHSSNKSRIAILFGVVAMPFLCALVSCGGEKKEIVDVGFDPNNSYTMKATQIVTFDCGRRDWWPSAVSSSARL